MLSITLRSLSNQYAALSDYNNASLANIDSIRSDMINGWLYYCQQNEQRLMEIRDRTYLRTSFVKYYFHVQNWPKLLQENMRDDVINRSNITSQHSTTDGFTKHMNWVNPRAFATDIHNLQVLFVSLRSC